MTDRVTQSRRMSAAEAVTNVAVGWLVSVAATAVVLPLFGYQVSLHAAAGISAIFTALSLARSYLLRRAFNRLHRNG